MDVVYLDHHATTPCDPRVVDAMLPYFTDTFGNPAAISTPHGIAAARAVETARASIAELLGVVTGEVLFTSGATESNHMAFAGLETGDHVITSSLEHRSVLEPLEAMRGLVVSVIDPGSDGLIDPDTVRDALTPTTRLVSITVASGEIGTVQPVEQIAAICRERGITVHTDATQAVGKIRWSDSCWGADLVSASGHKFYGPKGIGLLIARRGARLSPWTRGGGQERGVRSGTLNVPGIVGIAEALAIRDREQDSEAERLIDLRSRVIENLTVTIQGVQFHGHPVHRLPGSLALSVRDIDADSIIHAMKNFSLSAGSACSSRQRGPSRALRGIGLGDSECLEVFRIGMGRSTSREDMDAFIHDLQRVTKMLRV